MSKDNGTKKAAAGASRTLYNVHLRVWRQDGPNKAGALQDYEVKDVHDDMSFLEMLDVLNEQLIHHGDKPVNFDSDCREGICGTCSCVVNGNAHGPVKAVTTCQLYMRDFPKGEPITVEPFRAGPFPVLRDLVTDRTSFDKIMAAGGYVSVNTGNAPDANAIPIGQNAAEAAMDSAACIGCAACVAACPNSSAMLFVSAKLSHLGHLPQGQTERMRRTLRMVEMMDEQGFGNCTNHGECSEACPKEISLENIARMNRDYLKAVLVSDE